MMMPLLAVLASLALLQEAAVETGSTPTRPLRLPDDGDLRPLLEGYRIEAREFTWKLRETQRTKEISIHALTFPSAVRGEIPENNTVHGRLWQPLEPARGRPGIVLLHWLGGTFTALELVGRHLASKGIPTLMIYLPHYGPRRAADPERREKFLGTDVARTRGNLRQAVLDVRRAGDWMASRPGIDPDRVGIVGISLGAVVGSLVVGVDDRFGRSVFVIGGGDLPAILYHDSKETRKVREHLDAAGWTRERLTEALHDVEPLTFAGRIQADRVLMLNAEKDEIIPRACTERLRKAMGDPRIRWFPGGHYSLVFKLAPVLKEIVAHVDPPAKEKKEEDR